MFQQISDILNQMENDSKQLEQIPKEELYERISSFRSDSEDLKAEFGNARGRALKQALQTMSAATRTNRNMEEK